MNKVMDPQKVAGTMRDFAMARYMYKNNVYTINVPTHNTVSAQHSLSSFSERMNMTEETMNDALDDILAESGDEEEEESIVNQVLDEIGIEISGKVREDASEMCQVGARRAFSLMERPPGLTGAQCSSNACVAVGECPGGAPGQVGGLLQGEGDLRRGQGDRSHARATKGVIGRERNIGRKVGMVFCHGDKQDLFQRITHSMHTWYKDFEAQNTYCEFHLISLHLAFQF